MKLLLLGLLLLAASPVKADDGWTLDFKFPHVNPATDAGRGTVYVDPNDSKTYMYFGADNSDPAEVFRSSDGVNWNQVNVTGFGTVNGQPASNEATWFSDFTFGGFDYLYAGAASNPAALDGAQVWRSTAGIGVGQWSLVFSSKTTGNIHNTTVGGGNGISFAVNGDFYIGTKNLVTGGEVWKSTSADWEGAWIQVATAGFGGGAAESPNVSYLKVFDDLTVVNQPQLYAATNCPTTSAQPCGQIWMSTGTATNTDIDTWTQVLVATKTAPFDTANTYSISAMESFNGWFYATTLNAANHAQMLRTQTPSNSASWTEVFSPDGLAAQPGCMHCFAVATSSEIHSLRNINGVLYAGTWDATNGLIVYRSSDGATGTWIRSNTSAGFGNANRQVAGDFQGLNSQIYADIMNPNASAMWVSAMPAPGTPVGTAQSVSSISWTWAQVAGYTSYSVFEASGGVVIGSTIPAFAETSLATNTAAGIYVGGVAGLSTGTLSAQTTVFTLAAPTTGYNIMQVNFSSITLSWGANTNPAGTQYQVAFYDAIVGATSTVATGAGTVATITNLITNDTYFITVNALNGNNIVARSPLLISTCTLATNILTAAIGGGGGTIILNPFNPANGLITLNIPPGAFAGPISVTLSVLAPAALPGNVSAAATLAGIGVAAQVDLVPLIEPTKTCTLSMTFPAASAVGFDQTRLLLARFDTTQQTWVPLPSTVSGSVVTGKTAHLSPFQIMQGTPSSTVKAAVAFPNPLRPALGQTFMTFSNLPANARVRIYTLTGVLVQDLTADATGTTSWDGTNKYGGRVASGIYFVYAQDATDKGRVTLKVGIER